MEHRLSCYSFARPRRSVQRQGTLPNNALHPTTGTRFDAAAGTVTKARAQDRSGRAFLIAGRIILTAAFIDDLWTRF
jgi:hypothetical protein